MNAGDPLQADRFIRTRMLLGAAACARLEQALVVVVGLGAVGSYACEALARAGVGRLRLVDFDTVRPSNINRQLYALGSTVGRLKAELAAERVRDINPACRVDARPLFVDETNAADLLNDGRPDLLIDAIDSFRPKCALLAAAVRTGLFTVSSMGAAARTDYAPIRVGDLSETDVCPLARRIRKQLKKQGIVSGIRCVYSTELPPPMAPAPDLDESAADPEPHQRGRPRRPLGSVSFLTGIFGLLAAREAILHLARLPQPATQGDPP